MATRTFQTDTNWDPLSTVTPQQASNILQQAAPEATATDLAGAAAAVPRVAAEAAGTPPPATVMIRNGDEYGSLSQMAPPGSQLVFNADDPNLAQEVADARQKGYSVGIWVVAAVGDDPTAFAQRLASISATYHPDVLVPNVEAVGQVSLGGGQWSSTMMDTYKGLAPNQNTAVAIMSNQAMNNDFNYSAYTSNGAGIWVETYLNDMTPTDAQAEVNNLKAMGVPDSMITTLLAPGQAGATGTPAAVYAPPPGYIQGTGTTTQTGTGTVFTWTPPPPQAPGGYISPGGMTGGGAGSTYPPGTTVPAPPGPGQPGSAAGPQVPPPPGGVQYPVGPPGQHPPGTGSKPQSWADFYFGSWGLDPADMKQLVAIMTKYDNANDATMAALAYIRGTGWYSQHFPGINLGIADGLYSDESGYRDYVNKLNVYAQQYLNRQVTTADVIQSLGGAVDQSTGKIVKVGAGVDPSYVGKVWEGQAWSQANMGETQFALGATGGGQATPAEQTALGQQNVGLSTALGMKVQNRLQNAVQRMSKLFEGQIQNPNLSLGQQGLYAPSLQGNRGTSPDLGA